MANPLRAIIQSNERIDASLHHIISVVTDDVNKAINDGNYSSLDQLRNSLRDTLIKVNNSKDLESLVPNMEIDLSVPGPTEDDIAVNEFNDAIALEQVIVGKIKYQLAIDDDLINQKMVIKSLYEKGTTEQQIRFNEIIRFNRS